MGGTPVSIPYKRVTNVIVCSVNKNPLWVSIPYKRVTNIAAMANNSAVKLSFNPL